MKMLKGTLRKDRLLEDEWAPDPLSACPPTPKQLNEWGAKEWKKTAAALTADGILTKMDLTLLAAYCNEFGNYWKCEDERKKIKGTNMKERNKSRGLFEMAQKHLKASRDIAVQFGFTPASRARISAPKDVGPSELDLL